MRKMLRELEGRQNVKFTSSRIILTYYEESVIRVTVACCEKLECLFQDA